MYDLLPSDIIKLIYDFDPTYREYMREHVLPELEDKLYGSWLNAVDYYTNDLGLLMHYTWGVWAYLSDMTEHEDAITFIN